MLGNYVFNCVICDCFTCVVHIQYCSNHKYEHLQKQTGPPKIPRHGHVLSQVHSKDVEWHWSQLRDSAVLTDIGCDS